MKITKTQKPVGLGYPLTKVQDYLRNNGFSEEDGLVSTFVNAAIDYIGTETWTYLQSTDYVGYLDSFKDFTINMFPVTEITSIKYYDVNGTLQTMSENTDYYVNLKGNFADVEFKNTFTLRDRPFNNIEITFKAGHLTWFDIPDDLVSALLLIVGDLNENRQSTAQGVSSNVISVPMAVKTILNNNSKRVFV